MRAFKIALGIIGLSMLGFQVAAAELPVAGTASLVVGPVSALGADGSSRTLHKNDAVFAGDRIVTGVGGYTRLGLLDGGSMVLRPETEFAIVSYRFQPGLVEPKPAAVPSPPPAVPAALQIGQQGGGTGNIALFRLLRGGFRAVSGLIGHINREEYAIATPVATMGIRGTAFWSVTCEAACAADGMVQGVLPAGEAAAGGTVSAVDQGQIVIVSSAGKTATVDASQFMLTTAAGTNVALPGLPGFLGAEAWLGANSAAAASPAAATSPALASAALSTVPAIGGVALAVVVGVAALATDSNDDGRSTSPTGTSPSSTTR